MSTKNAMKLNFLFWLFSSMQATKPVGQVVNLVEFFGILELKIKIPIICQIIRLQAAHSSEVVAFS